MTNSLQLDELKRQLADLRERRTWAEWSDDFAYTNGTIARYDAQIRAVEREIELAKKHIMESFTCL